MTDIPDQAVTGGVKHIMQCQREFNCTQTRRQMSAGSRDCVDQVVADFLGQLGQLCLLELAQIRWRIYAVQKNILWRFIHRESRIRADVWPELR